MPLAKVIECRQQKRLSKQSLPSTVRHCDLYLGELCFMSAVGQAHNESMCAGAFLGWLGQGTDEVWKFAKVDQEQGGNPSVWSAISGMANPDRKYTGRDGRSWRSWR